MIKKYKIIKFNTILTKRKLKETWEGYDFCLKFEKEWKNFLDICNRNKLERILALNNFLITEFLISYCGLKPELLNIANSTCDRNTGKLKITNEIYNKNKHLIKNFLVSFS
ncbi:hypothetical protein HZB06_01035 [Candidatus Wolfebacteria bacterium]|nr:hypothetical protein [Candidatus Wolfebacteria bacterium]